MNKEYIQSLAEELTNSFNTNDPFEIADYLGISVNFANLSTLKGFYTCILQNKFICINRNLSKIEQSLICAHELGHERLHSNLDKLMKYVDTHIFCTTKHEHEANLFAACLLVPDDLVERYKHSNFTYKQIAASENLYPELVRIRLKW